MAGADTVTAGSGKVTYKPYKSRRFDTKVSEKEHAALWRVHHGNQNTCALQ